MTRPQARSPSWAAPSHAPETMTPWAPRCVGALLPLITRCRDMFLSPLVILTQCLPWDPQPDTGTLQPHVQNPVPVRGVEGPWPGPDGSQLQPSRLPYLPHRPSLCSARMGSCRSARRWYTLCPCTRLTSSIPAPRASWRFSQVRPPAPGGFWGCLVPVCPGTACLLLTPPPPP